MKRIQALIKFILVLAFIGGAAYLAVTNICLSRRITKLESRIQQASRIDEDALARYIQKKNKRVSRDESRQIAAKIAQNIARYAVPLEHVISWIWQESEFNPKAKGKAGEKGLVQILPSTGNIIAKALGRQEYDMFDIGENLDFGFWYLAQQFQSFGTWEMAMAAYNAGNTVTMPNQYAESVLARLPTLKIELEKAGVLIK